jgi:tetratricopeptide (TPR) repeat protein
LTLIAQSESIAPGEDGNRAQIDTLEARGLIRLIAVRPELEYLFRHWLIQDAAYGSLLKQERRDLHGRVGRALESLYPERRDELAGMLSVHFEQAGDTAKALDYLVLAGTQALDRNALQEAYSAFDRAAALLTPAAPEDDDALRRRRVEIEIGRVRASWSFRPPEAVIADLAAIVPEAERLNDPKQVAMLYLYLSMTRLLSGVPASDPDVQRSLDRITSIGEAIGDPSFRALPMAIVGMSQIFSGQLRPGVAALEEAVPIFEQGRDFIGTAFARGALAIGYAELGEFDKAEAAAARAKQLAADGDLIAQLDAEIADAMVHSQRGDLDAALPLAEACVKRAEDAGASACVVASSWILGDVYNRQGRFGEARKALRRGSDLSLLVNRKTWRPSIQAWLGSTGAVLDNLDASGDFDEALATARSIDNRYGEAGILAKRAETALRRGEQKAALPDYEAAAGIFEAVGARPSLARALNGWGQALRAAGREEEAGVALRRALALFEELDIQREAAGVRASLDPKVMPIRMI